MWPLLWHCSSTSFLSQDQSALQVGEGGRRGGEASRQASVNPALWCMPGASSNLTPATPSSHLASLPLYLLLQQLLLHHSLQVCPSCTEEGRGGSDEEQPESM